MLSQRLRTAVRSTPARLALWLVALLAVILAYGITSLVSGAQTGAQVSSVRTSSGPLTVAAQSLYRSLSDADATAAGAFLSSGPEPPALRQRYADDIAAAGVALAQVSAGDAANSGLISQLATQLPVYTGLVETARADNRIGYPIGAAYLREASSLMRGTLLLAAASLYNVETVRLTDDRDGAARYPYPAVALGVLALAGLIRAQIYLTRRTQRVINPGVAVATLAVLVSVIWANIAWLGLATHLDAADRTGSAQVKLLAQARIAALQARADEALTLVARGSGAVYDTDYTNSLNRLIGDDGRGGLLASASADATDPAVRAAVDKARSDAQAWRTVHLTVRKADDGGNHTTAVGLAIGADPTSAATAFNHVDADLDRGIQLTNAAFSDEAAKADRATDGVAVAVGLLTLLALAGVAVGIQRRIAEYR